MTNETIVERVRDAIEVAIHKAGGFESMSAEDGNAVARAAIEAMREPNILMVESASHLVEGDSAVQYTQNTYKVWRLMIDVALKSDS